MKTKNYMSRLGLGILVTILISLLMLPNLVLGQSKEGSFSDTGQEVTTGENGKANGLIDDSDNKTYNEDSIETNKLEENQSQTTGKTDGNLEDSIVNQAFEDKIKNQNGLNNKSENHDESKSDEDSNKHDSNNESQNGLSEKNDEQMGNKNGRSSQLDVSPLNHNNRNKVGAGTKGEPTPDNNGENEQEETEEEPKTYEDLKTKADEIFLGQGAQKIEERLKGNENIKKYNELKAQAQDLMDKKPEEVKKKEIDEFFQKLKDLKIPRELTGQEQDITEEIQKAERDLGVLKEDSSEDEVIKNDIRSYLELKERLKGALDPNTEEASLDKESEDYKKFLELKGKVEGYLKDGKIKRLYTEKEEGLEIKIFLEDQYGRVEENLTPENGKGTYYLPQNTPLDLLVQIGQNPDTRERIRITIDSNADISPGRLYLFGSYYDFEKKDGQYSVEVKTGSSGGVSEIPLRILGLSGHYGEEFTLTISEGDNNAIEEAIKLRITKSGYEDQAHIGGVSDQEEIDAGPKGEDWLIDPEKAKEKEFWLELVRNNNWLDEVLRNGPLDPLDLEEFELELDLPKNQEEKFAEYIHKKGLEFHEEKGKLILKLSRKALSKNLEIDQDGKLKYRYGETEAELESLKEDDPIFEKDGLKIVDQSIDKIFSQGDKHYGLAGNKVFELQKNDKAYYEQLGEAVEVKNNIFKLKGKTFQIIGKELYSYEEKYQVNYEPAFNEKEPKEANEAIREVKGSLIEIQDGDKTYFGGRIIKTGDDELAIFDDNKKYVGIGKLVDKVNSSSEDDYQIEKKTEEGKDIYIVYDKLGQVPGLLVNQDQGFAVVDKYGRRLNFNAKEEEGKWIFRDLEGKDRAQKDKIKVSEKETPIVVGGSNLILKEDSYEKVDGPNYYDGSGKIFREIQGYDEENLKGKYYYQGLEILDLSTDKIVRLKDLYKLSLGEETFYHEKKEGPVYQKISGPDQAPNYLSKEDISYIGQDFGGEEIYRGQGTIYDLVKETRFALKFPAFRPGKDYKYTIKGQVQASYLDGDSKKSIFKDKDGSNDLSGDKTISKEIQKTFTLKDYRESLLTFGKRGPKELSKGKPMDYELFNILYRSEDDRGRDSRLKEIFSITEDGLKDLDGEEKKRKTEDLRIKKLIISEYRRFYGGELDLVDGQLKLKVEDSEGKISHIDPERSMVWEISLNNSGDVRFPENDSEKVIITETHLDNRLVYESIIINHRGSFDLIGDKLKEDSEDPRDHALVFLDEIDKIYLGVNPFYKEKNFIGVDGYEISKDVIVEALKSEKKEIQLTDPIKAKVELDEKTGQIKIYVKDAFYNKDGVSPVQDVYRKAIAEKLDGISGDIKKLDQASQVEDDTIKNILKKIYGEIQSQDIEIPEEEKAREAFISELKDRLEILKSDHLRGEAYNAKDMRFNAIQIHMDKSFKAGGLTPKKDRTIKIGSVIGDKVDVPFTDEFGDPLTNFEMIVSEKFKDLSEGKNTNDEIDYRKILKDLYSKIDKEKIVTLVDKDEDSHHGYVVRKGSDLENDDLKYIEELLKINPYYIKGEKVDLLSNEPLRLVNYYQADRGYNGAKFKNEAFYLVDFDGGESSVFGDGGSRYPKTQWGILPLFPEKWSSSGQEPGQDPDEEKRESKNEITIGQSISTPNPRKDNPGLEKTGDKYVDISEDSKKKTVDFTINTRLDFQTRTDYILGELNNSEKSQDEIRKEIDGKFNERGYRLIKDAFIMDLLPEEIYFGENSNLEFTVNEGALKANGANPDLNITKFKEASQIIYIGDLSQYYKKAPENIKKHLEAHKDKSTGAVLVLLPEFEGPTGDQGPQFSLKLRMEIKEKPKEMMRENRAEFISEPWIGYDTHEFNVKGKDEGLIDKYLRATDKEGNPIDDWHKGNLDLKFGDKFDYKISYKIDSTTDTSELGGFSSRMELKLEDILPSLKNGSLRPILRGPARIYVDDPDEKSPEKFTLKYFEGKNEIKKPDDYSKVTRIEVSNSSFNPSRGINIILPMEIPEVKLSVEDGRVKIENAGYFNLEELKSENPVKATNTASSNVSKSNEVSVRIKKDQNLIISKIWKDSSGKLIEDESILKSLKAKFKIYRKVNSKGEEVQEFYDEVELNFENGFQVSLDKLPKEYKEIYFKVDSDGKLIKDEERSIEISYSGYRAEEVAQYGWEGSLIESGEGYEFISLHENKMKEPEPEPEPRDPEPEPEPRPDPKEPEPEPRPDPRDPEPEPEPRPEPKDPEPKPEPKEVEIEDNSHTKLVEEAEEVGDKPMQADNLDLEGKDGRLGRQPSGLAPKTFDPGIGIYLGLAGFSALAIAELERRKKRK